MPERKRRRIKQTRERSGKQRREKSSERDLPSRVVCPCCRQECNVTRDTPLMAMEMATPGPWWGAPGWSIWLASNQQLRGRNTSWLKLKWACRGCIQAGRALQAETRRQRFTDHAPIFAYVDETYSCADCLTTFTFSAKEQQFWFETLRFWVMSHPKQCVACRKKRREYASLLKKLRNAVTQLVEDDPLQLLTIAKLHQQLGNETSCQHYLGRSRNLARSQRVIASWRCEAKRLELPVPESPE